MMTIIPEVTPAQTEWRQWLARQLLDDRLSDHEAANVVAFHPSVTDEWRKSPPPAQTETKMGPMPEKPGKGWAMRDYIPSAPVDEPGLGYRLSDKAKAQLAALEQAQGAGAASVQNFIVGSSSPSPAQWPEDVVRVVQLYNIPELLDELNGRQRSCVDGREIVAGKYHDASVASDKLRAALATLPPPEDERVKGLVEALEAIANSDGMTVSTTTSTRQWAHASVHVFARSALASYRGGA